MSVPIALEMAQAKLNDAEAHAQASRDALAGAEALCKAHLLSDSTNGPVLHMLGTIQFKLNQFEAALDSFRHAAMFGNDVLQHHHSLGMTLLMLGRTEDAITAFQNATLCMPGEALPHKWLSDIFKRERRMKEASAAYGRWVELNPEVRANNVKESSKARARREQAGFFEKYCQGQGIDIGHGGDKLLPQMQGWDFEDGDAEEMEGLADKSFDFVYSSHNLEHLYNVDKALLNWWRILKPGGYLILFLPHRDLFEKRRTLPSAVHDHRHYFLPESDDLPDTIGVTPMIKRLLPDAEIITCVTCDELNDLGQEYSIEVVVRKKS